ncbi:beta-glucosidase-like glycosyl hydrolase [Streptomyces canus]|nr:beta-glucosidase-like glycosyl hydrolase [Streptomyces canus]
MWPGWDPATVFPQAVGLSATWNDGLLRRVGDAVAQKTRTMRARDNRMGLNVWAPTVSLLRHPLRGRNEEGYAENPHLTAAIATAYTRGLRGDDPAYWMTAPVLKRWPAHNNETDRSTSSSSARPRVLHEYDMRAFRRPVEARRRGRGDARAQPRQWAAEPCLAVPAGTPSDLDGPGNRSLWTDVAPRPT